MDELIELGFQTGCWYRLFKEDGDDYVICRTGMTHISFKIDYSNIEAKTETEMMEEMESYLELHKRINRRKDKEHQSVWNIIGYCGTMFLDWLDESKKYIDSNSDRSDKKLVIQIYIDGIKLIKESLNEILN